MSGGTLSRMRTLDAAIAELKREDPDTSVTRYALRMMVLSGKVPHVRTGKKYLINYDALLSVLSGNTISNQSTGW